MLLRLLLLHLLLLPLRLLRLRLLRLRLLRMLALAHQVAARVATMAEAVREVETEEAVRAVGREAAGGVEATVEAVKEEEVIVEEVSAAAMLAAVTAVAMHWSIGSQAAST